MLCNLDGRIVEMVMDVKVGVLRKSQGQFYLTLRPKSFSYRGMKFIWTETHARNSKIKKTFSDFLSKANNISSYIRQPSLLVFEI
jgi:hypothetical protein